jgi:hypothetical protein
MEHGGDDDIPISESCQIFTGQIHLSDAFPSAQFSDYSRCVLGGLSLHHSKGM